MQDSNEKLILKNKKYNQKLYKIYKMLSWDLLFYYAVSFLFLTQEKSFSTSEIIFADAFYPLFKLVLQLPCTLLVQKVGKRNGLIVGNLSVFTYVLMTIGVTSVSGFIVANFFCALGFTIKSLCEINILTDSIENTENKNVIFSKIDGFASSLYYYFDAITAVCSAFLFVINPYIPMILCLCITIISVVLSFKFKHIPSTKSTESTKNHEDLSFIKQLKFYINDLKQAFKFIAKSNRLRALIIFNAVFASFIAIMVTMRRSVLTEIEVPDAYFGIIFAIWGLIAGFASNAASRVQKTFGNQTLTFFSIAYTGSIIFAGLVAILSGLPGFLYYFLILILFTIHSMIAGPYYTLIQQYLGSFATSNMRTKISSATVLIESITRTVISFVISFLTDNASSAVSTLVIGVGFGVILMFVLSYMKTRVGLKPEEYPEKDIKFKEVY